MVETQVRDITLQFATLSIHDDRSAESAEIYHKTSLKYAATSEVHRARKKFEHPFKNRVSKWNKRHAYLTSECML